MANVQFGGLITGLDTKALIAGLVAAESRPITIMTGQKTVLQARGAVYTALAGALGGLKSAAQGLSLGNDFNKRAASSSDATVLTVSADRRRNSVTPRSPSIAWQRRKAFSR